MASEMKEESNSTSSDVKNEESSDETKKIDNEVKDDKDSVKSENKEESGKERSDDEDEESEDEEVALLDRPVEVTGCRARKKVERLEISFNAPKEKQEIPEGKGKKLGDCPRIEAQIQKMKPIDLKPMHKILFNRIGSMNEIKKNIRKFSGFPFEKDSTEFARKKASVEKLTASVLKQVCLTLDIERSGTKEEIVNRIMSFLLNPVDSGKKVPAPQKKASKDKKKSSAKKVKSEKKVKSSKDDSDDDAEESVEDDDDSTGGEASMGGTDEEAEALLTEPKKKSKESKKVKPKAEKAKKEDKKQKATKRKHDNDDDDDAEKSSGSSEDEPAVKRMKMPSDEDISKLVKQILESADLQEITMKKVIKQVSDAYPDFDLSHKKAFIKSTIKSIL